MAKRRILYAPFCERNEGRWQGAENMFSNNVTGGCIYGLQGFSRNQIIGARAWYDEAACSER